MLMTVQEKFEFIKNTVYHPHLCRYIDQQNGYFISGNDLDTIKKKKNDIKKGRTSKYYKIEEIYEDLTRDYPYVKPKNVKGLHYYRSSISKRKYNEEIETTDHFPYTTTG